MNNEIKVNLSIMLPGSRLYSELDISKAGHMEKKFREVMFEEKHTMSLWNAKKKKSEKITFYTRKCKPASKSINLTKDAYEDMISIKCPSFFKNIKQWKKMSDIQRLEVHLDRIAEHNGGTVLSYTVFED